MIYDDLLARRDQQEAVEDFIDLLQLGCICWPSRYAQAAEVLLHYRIDRCRH